MKPDEYRKMAEVEDSMWYYRGLHGQVYARLRAAAGGKGRMLDAGCGTGGLLRYFAQRAPDWRLVGLDLFPEACALARERTSAEIVQASVLQLPFAAESFDGITSCDVLSQVESPQTALREFHRCLAPGGVVVLTMPAYQWMYSYHDRAVANVRRYTRSEVNALFRGAGFRVLRSTYFNCLSLPLAVARRKIFPPREVRSDVGRFPAPVEGMFNAMSWLERAWIGAGGRLPAGTSVLTVARKS